MGYANQILIAAALGLTLASTGIAYASVSASDGSFQVANMAPPEPEAPPTVPDPAAAPTAPEAPTADAPPPPEELPAAPETPPEPPAADVPAPEAEAAPVAEETAPAGGMGMSTILGIVAALAAAGFGAFWFMRRK